MEFLEKGLEKTNVLNAELEEACLMVCVQNLTLFLDAKTLIVHFSKIHAIQLCC